LTPAVGGVGIAGFGEVDIVRMGPAVAHAALGVVTVTVVEPRQVDAPGLRVTHVQVRVFYQKRAAVEINRVRALGCWDVRIGCVPVGRGMGGGGGVDGLLDARVAAVVAAVDDHAEALAVGGTRYGHIAFALPIPDAASPVLREDECGAGIQAVLHLGQVVAVVAGKLGQDRGEVGIGDSEHLV